MIAAQWMIALLLTGPASDEPGPSLPPAARIHNDRALTHLESGQYAQAVDELELAYAYLPDPLTYRTGRGDIVGSMRSALNRLHAATGDPAPLIRLRAILLRHLEALLLALGPTATPEDTAGILAALREVSGKLPAEQPVPGPPGVAPRMSRRAPVVHPVQPVAPPAADATSARRSRIAGGALLGVGFAAVGVMAYGIVVHVDRRDRLAALTAAIVASGEPKSDLERQTGEQMYRSARGHQVLAIVSGVVGAAASATGVALLLAGKRRSRALARIGVQPTLGSAFWGLRFTGGF